LELGSTVLWCNEDGDRDNVEGFTVEGVGTIIGGGFVICIRDGRDRRELRLRCCYFLTLGGSQSAAGGITLVGGSTT